MDTTRPIEPSKKRYDLEERTARFGESVIALAKQIALDSITQRLIPQLVAAATGVGANYCEATEAPSRGEFRDRLSACKMGSRKAKHYLRMIAFSCVPHRAEALRLLHEAQELTLIFAASVRTIDTRLEAQAPHGPDLDTHLHGTVF